MCIGLYLCMYRARAETKPSRFDALASTWNERPFIRRTMQLYLHWIEQHATLNSDTTTVLDFACGTGQSTERTGATHAERCNRGGFQRAMSTTALYEWMERAQTYGPHVCVAGTIPMPTRPTLFVRSSSASSPFHPRFPHRPDRAQPGAVGARSRRGGRLRGHDHQYVLRHRNTLGVRCGLAFSCARALSFVSLSFLQR